MILEGASETREAGLSSPGGQLWAASRQTDILPGHCGRLSYTGQMPKSKIFAPQNTEADICDSLLRPSFYRVDKKICWLPYRIICKGKVICLHFINPVIMLAMKLPIWLLHVFFKHISQHFARSLSNTPTVLYIDKVSRIVQKEDLKALLNISGNYSALEQYLQPFAVWASLSVSFLLVHNWNCSWDVGKGQPNMLSMISQLLHLFCYGHPSLTRCAVRARRPCSPQAAPGM